MSVSDGTLLGGRVRYAQPASGYRTGIEPVLLAACVPTRPGERVLEAGTGAGAGLLCLAARVPGLAGVGVERDAGQAALARANFAANGFEGLRVAEGDLLSWRADGGFDHAFANPPWHAAAGTASADALRFASKQARPGLLADWVAAMARAVRRRGSVTLVVPAGHLAEGVVALSGAGCREVRLMPLWPRRGMAAKIIVLQGVVGGRGACRVGAGLVLHGDKGNLTNEAEDIFRTGNAITFMQQYRCQ